MAEIWMSVVYPLMNMSFRCQSLKNIKQFYTKKRNKPWITSERTS